MTDRIIDAVANNPEILDVGQEIAIDAIASVAGISDLIGLTDDVDIS